VKKLVEAVMHRAAILTIVVVLLLAWGGFSVLQMQRDYWPGINNTTLMVSLRASVYQADQVKRDITHQSSKKSVKPTGFSILKQHLMMADC